MKKYLLVLQLAALFNACWRPVPAHSAEPALKVEKYTQNTLVNMTVMFPPTVRVSGGPGGPRDFVGIFTSPSPTAAMVAWLYLDGTKDQSAAALAKRRLTEAVLTFDVVPATGTAPIFNGVPSDSKYEARFFSWQPGGPPHKHLYTIPLEPPPARLEWRELPAEGPIVVTRRPLGNRDEVIVTRKDGSRNQIMLDRGVLLEISPVAATTGKNTNVASEP